MKTFVKLTLCCFGLVVATSACKPKQKGMQNMAMPVRLGVAEKENVEEVVSLIGTLSANESVDIRAEVDGIVQAIDFIEGQRVEKDKVVVTIANEDLRAQLLEAEANYALAAQNFNRAEQLIQKRAIAIQDYEEAHNKRVAAQAMVNLCKSRIDKTIIEAPFTGVVGARLVSPGQYVNGNTTITTLADTDVLKADFSIPERFLSELKEGQTIKLKVQAYPNRSFEGTVYFISPIVDASTRTVLLRALVKNDDKVLKPGMFVGLDLVLNKRADAVVVPEEAITIVSRNPAVFAVKDGKANLHFVKTGFRMPGKVEIIEGLQGGEQIIVAGQQKVRDGMPVVDLTQLRKQK